MNVLIVGGGLMGSGIAAICASAGNSVCVVSPSEKTRLLCRERANSVAHELRVNEMITDQQAEYILNNIVIQQELPAEMGAFDMVIEAIAENLEAKQKLFAQLDELVPVDVPIMSNTSGLRITDIVRDMTHKERAMSAHFWFPAHLVPLVEVVMSEWTCEALAQDVCTELKRWGKAPVLVRQDLPGQLANRILQAMIREATNIVDKGIASAEDVDTAIKMGMALRLPVWGILEHVDGVGVDLCQSVQNTVLPGLSSSTEAAPIFREKVANGELGYKSGKGFYDWSKKDMAALERLRNEYIMYSVRFIRERTGEK